RTGVARRGPAPLGLAAASQRLRRGQFPGPSAPRPPAERGLPAAGRCCCVSVLVPESRHAPPAHFPSREWLLSASEQPELRAGRLRPASPSRWLAGGGRIPARIDRGP